MSPPRHPSAIPPPTSVTRTPTGRNVSVVSPSPSRASCPYQAFPVRKIRPEEHDRDDRANAALQNALGDERSADERERRPDELHDFNFVTTGVSGEPHHVGDRQGRGDREQRHDDESDGADEPDGGTQTAQPAAVVADVGDAGLRPQAGGEIVDRGGRPARLCTETHFERRRQRIPIEPFSGARQIRKVFAESRQGVGLGQVLALGGNAGSGRSTPRAPGPARASPHP